MVWYDLGECFVVVIFLRFQPQEHNVCLHLLTVSATRTQRFSSSLYGFSHKNIKLVFIFVRCQPQEHNVCLHLCTVSATRTQCLSSYLYGVSHKNTMFIFIFVQCQPQEQVLVFTSIKTSSITMAEIHSRVSIFVIETDTAFMDIGNQRMTAQLDAPSVLILRTDPPLHIKCETEWTSELV